MKRLVVLLVVLVPVSVFIAGCGPSGGGATKNSAEVTQKQTDSFKEGFEAFKKAKVSKPAQAPGAPQK